MRAAHPSTSRVRRPRPVIPGRGAALTAALASLAALSAGCSGAAGSQAGSDVVDEPRRTTIDSWDRPSNQHELVEAAGLPLLSEEDTTVHYHAHLTVLVDGTSVPVPADLGINAAPGGAPPEHGEPGIAPLHTHDTRGVLHVESPAPDEFTLGQVFTLWGVALEDGRVGAYHDGDDADRDVEVYVNGTRYDGDPTDLVLEPHQEVTVVAGPADEPVDVPTSYDFAPGE